jgi:hypothetical protein
MQANDAGKRDAIWKSLDLPSSEKGNAMNRPIEDSKYSELKQEIEALRKKLGEMESEQARSRISSRATGGRWLSRNPALVVFLVIAGALLTLGVLVAQSSQPDALFINQSGNVGIGTKTPGFPLTFADKPGDKISLVGQTGSHYGLGMQPGLLQIHSLDKQSDIAFGYGSSGSFTETMRIKGTGNVGIGTDPKATLDVAGTLKVSGNSHFNGGIGINTAPIANQNLVITPTKGSMPFNVTDPGGGINWLSVMPQGQVLMNGGSVGIGTTDPKARLDVKGEIRGRPWVSEEYEWKMREPAKRMTKADRSVCFLTLISGQFYGGGEVVQITQSGGYWMLGGITGEVRGVRAKARCMGAPDDSW